jgi:hypothetical protein
VNILTVAVFLALLLYDGGVAAYVWRVRGKARSRWIVRYALGALALMVALEVAGLLTFYKYALDVGLAIDVLVAVWLPASAALQVANSTRPIDPALPRYPYRPAKRDRQMILLAFAALGVPMVVVLAVVVAHNVG